MGVRLHLNGWKVIVLPAMARRYGQYSISDAVGIMFALKALLCDLRLVVCRYCKGYALFAVR